MNLRDMKLFSLLFLMISFAGFSQGTDLNLDNCWQEYRHEGVPENVEGYCAFILCEDNSTVCYDQENEEIYTDSNGWKRTSTNQIQLADETWLFNILLETENELHIQSVKYPNFKIYLKR